MAVTGGIGRADDGIPVDALIVNDQLSIPRSELETKTSRSSGAGGQHVNKTSSRVEISWNVSTSVAVTDEQRLLLTSRLASRLSVHGAVRVVASDTRSQLRNRERAEARLIDLVRRALIVPRKRKPTKRPRAANEARLTTKKKHSDKKRGRQRRIAD